MISRLSLLLCCALLSACATSYRVQETPVDPDNTYQPVAGREGAVIDPLRAAAPPETAELLQGKSLAGDSALLQPKAYVLIGTSRHRHDDEAARTWIVRQGKDLGADKIRWYAPAQWGDAALGAAYFVRLRLVFGATFRDLNAAERKAYPQGVRLGDIVGGSPASLANLRSADIITALDGKPVKDRGTFQALLRENMGRTVELTMGRSGETLRRRVQLGRSFGETPGD